MRKAEGAKISSQETDDGTGILDKRDFTRFNLYLEIVPKSSKN